MTVVHGCFTLLLYTAVLRVCFTCLFYLSVLRVCFAWRPVVVLWYVAVVAAVVQVDACMVATGRVPNTKTLGLENMGIETNRGFVQARPIYLLSI